MAREYASEADMQMAGSRRDPEPACAVALIGSACVAIELAVVLWATYDAFDHNGFNVNAAVVNPVLAALGFQTAQSTQGARATIVMPAHSGRTTSR